MGGLSVPAAMLIGSLVAAGGGVAAAEVSKVDPPKPPPPPDDPSIAQARLAEERRRTAGKAGRASTIMSGSPLGVPGGATSGAGRGSRLTGGY